METILRQIEAALERDLHYLAVVHSLMLPDICAALESEKGSTSETLYKAWVEQWVIPKYRMMTAKGFYRLRSCSIHQARFSSAGLERDDLGHYDGVVFALPSPNVFHGNLLYDSSGKVRLQLDANVFCRDMIGCVREWLAVKGGEAQVISNLEEMFQFRPDGLPGVFPAVPVIA